ncbi:hypothetical protein ACIGFL_09380 [Pseudomonas sp. NPDC077649]|uniref:hypothetical protein n=1 Tax=Pseudomonas sp. NPDC077649 TaxID=3364423 RepID=UPI0037C7CD61
MSEQKMDAERAAFETWFGDYSLPVRMNGGMMNDAQMFDAWKARADQSAIAPESWWHLIHDTLKNYCMHTLSDGEGGGYPLIDAMTADGQSVSGGIEECTYLADAIWNALASSVPAAPTVKAELTAVRCQCCQTEYAADSYDAGFIAGSGMCQVCDVAMPAKDLPVAGMEEPTVVAWMWRDLNGDVQFNYMHPEGQELMTVAQHNRIVAALSAQQAVAVSVPAASEYPKVGWTKRHKHTCANVQPGATAADKCDCGAVEHDNRRAVIERAIHFLRSHSPSMDCAEWETADELRALLSSSERGGEA